VKSKIIDMYEEPYNLVGFRLTDKVFIRLWQTSSSIENFTEREVELWTQYEEYIFEHGTRAQKKWLSRANWTAKQRAAYLKNVGIPLKPLKCLKTEKQAKRAKYLESLKEYAIEVLNESR
jgi:hypothetical protein